MEMPLLCSISAISTDTLALLRVMVKFGSTPCITPLLEAAMLRNRIGKGVHYLFTMPIDRMEAARHTLAMQCQGSHYSVVFNRNY
jgi:hypothetical protein